MKKEKRNEIETNTCTLMKTTLFETFFEAFYLFTLYIVSTEKYNSIE